jgi:hypothetical protein
MSVTGNYYNFALGGASGTWSAAFAGTDTAPINSVQANLVIFESSAPDVKVDVDTIAIEVWYTLPSPIVRSPTEYEFVLASNPSIFTKNDFARPPIKALDLTLNDSEMLRADTIRLDPKQLILNTYSVVENYPFYPDKNALTLAGKIPILVQTRDPASDDLTLAGKVLDGVNVTENQWIDTPHTYANTLSLSGQDIGFEDYALPGRGRINLASDAPVLQRSWKSSPNIASLKVIKPLSPEYIWPVSWDSNGWSGDVTNIDEYRNLGDSGDGLAISVDQINQHCRIDFSDVQEIRDGIDTITDMYVGFRTRASSPAKLYVTLRINGVAVDAFDFTMLTSWGGLLLVSASWASHVIGTDTGPINSIQLDFYILDSGVVAEIDYVFIQLTYDSVDLFKPVLDSGCYPSKLPLVISGRSLEPVDTGNRIPVETLALAGKVPSTDTGFITSPGNLILRSDTELILPAATLSLAGKAPVIRAIVPGTGPLSLAGKAPALVFGTVLPPGDHGMCCPRAITVL